MSFYSRLVIAILIGQLLFLFGPLLITSYLSTSQRTELADYYHHLCSIAMGRINIVRRLSGGLTLTPSSIDDELGHDKLKVGSDTKHLVDVYGAKGRWRNKPFGIVYEGLGYYIDPRLSEIGEHAWIQAGEPESFDELTLPDTPRFIDPARAIHVSPGNSDPSDPETTNTLVKIAESLFNSRRTAAGFSLVTGAVLGFGFVFVATKYGGGGGSMDVARFIPQVILPGGLLW